MRTGADDAFSLLRDEDLLILGTRADAVRRTLHPEGLVTFVIDRNINYTNVCLNECRFCAFYRAPDAPDAYLLTVDDVLAKVSELVEHGGTQVLIQGGLHPGVGIEYVEGMFKAIRRGFPQVIIHSLSPAEILHLSKQAGLPVDTILQRLVDAGLESLPGGGAEMLVDRVRMEVSPRKIASGDWFAVMRAAARLGMKGTATMMFGSVETDADIVAHLARVRDFQDETGFFRAFIPWTYQPGNTALGGSAASALRYLRVLALSRLYLDNVPNIQASWVTQGAKVSQVALFFGANDMGGTMLEENVVAAAGVRFMMDRAEIEDLIREAGFHPAVRNTRYEMVDCHRGVETNPA